MRAYLNELHQKVKEDPRLRWRILRMLRRFGNKENLLHAEVGVILSGDSQLAWLNSKYRYEKEVTDVLSFPMVEEKELEQLRFKRVNFILGEVYISVDRAVAQAEEDSRPWESRLLYLLAHGLYHLLGYDHTDERETSRMELKVKELVSE